MPWHDIRLNRNFGCVSASKRRKLSFALLLPLIIFAVGKIRPIRDCPKNNRIPALSTRTHPESRHLLPAEGMGIQPNDSPTRHPASLVPAFRVVLKTKKTCQY